MLVSCIVFKILLSFFWIIVILVLVFLMKFFMVCWNMFWERFMVCVFSIGFDLGIEYFFFWIWVFIFWRFLINIWIDFCNIFKLKLFVLFVMDSFKGNFMIDLIFIFFVVLFFVWGLGVFFVIIVVLRFVEKLDVLGVFGVLGEIGGELLIFLFVNWVKCKDFDFLIFCMIKWSSVVLLLIFFMLVSLRRLLSLNVWVFFWYVFMLRWFLVFNMVFSSFWNVWLFLSFV